MNNFKDLEKAFDNAEAAFSKVLLAQVEHLATSVILSHPYATCFTMAMGSAFFSCSWTVADENDPDDPWSLDGRLHPDEIGKVTGVPSSYSDDLANLLDKYDSNFHLTGVPMMIRQVSEYSVTVDNDW